jgi:hypothetical protein
MNKSMKNRHFILLAIFSILFSSCQQLTEPGKVNPSLTLWYDQPATEWTEALPLGNGRIGAMVYGETENETIQFNEETFGAASRTIMPTRVLTITSKICAGCFGKENRKKRMNWGTNISCRNLLAS